MSHIINNFPKLAFALVNHCLPSSSTNLFKREMASNQAKNLCTANAINNVRCRYQLFISQIPANGRLYPK